MMHLIILPVVLPALLAPFVIMTIRYHMDLQRIFSLAGTVALVARISAANPCDSGLS